MERVFLTLSSLAQPTVFIIKIMIKQEFKDPNKFASTNSQKEEKYKRFEDKKRGSRFVLIMLLLFA